MKSSHRIYQTPSKYQPDSNLFVPVFFILTLIALVNASQTYYLLHPSVPSLLLLLRIVFSKMIYCWYFVILGLVVQGHAKRIPLNRQTTVRLFGIHLSTLILSFFIHETISLETDKLIWGKELKASVLYLFFNNPSVWIETLVYVLFLLLFYLLEYQRVNRENEIKCSKLEVQLTHSKLKELRSKIQPTFLFNTLQSILELIRTHQNKDANHILSLLSDFLRTTVYDNEREEISLEEELRFLNQYLEIEKVRCRQSFGVREEIGRDVTRAVVPNFILQPIIEGLIYRTAGQHPTKYEIMIRAQKVRNDLEIVIEDHPGGIPGHQEDIERNDIIPEITKERLLQLYGNNQELTVCAKPYGGILVRIRIPFLEMNEEPEGAFIMENVL
jgi:two-component system, LytTR family, sensor kinase